MAHFSILVVDDEPDNFDVVETLLADRDYELHYASSGRNAIAFLETCQPDLILLDVMMPDMDGIEACQCIKNSASWRSIPIVMVTALTSKKDLSRCLAAGADDFMSKPINRLELTARVRSMLRIRQQYQQLQSFNSQLETTVRKRTAQLQIAIEQDALTRLPSRTRLLHNIVEALSVEEAPCALICLDLDCFKLVNGSFGYAVGNQLLVEIAHRLQSLLLPGDCLARMGGDEFCFLMHRVEQLTVVERYIHTIQKSFETPFRVADCDIFMSACMGVALSGKSDRHAEGLIQDADTAMYQAKLKGKGRYKIFDRRMHVEMLDRLTLENDLQRALEREEFVTYFQPIFHLNSHQISGFEALVRWHHPERGMVPPGRFISCMETTGLIIPVGMTILEAACQQLAIWHERNSDELTMSVNLSVCQFSSPTLLDDIDRILHETKVNPSRIKLEITESAIMDNARSAIELTEKIRSRNIQISIDDFGTGYSSLGYLHQFPVDNLKIDRSFLNIKKSQSRKHSVVDTIVALSKQLQLEVIAEGIETLDQFEWLQHLGCEYGQGYLFSKPLPASEIESTFLGTEPFLQN